MLIQRALLTTTGTTRDNGLNAARFKMLQDGVGIVSFVGRQTGGVEFGEQRPPLGAVARPAARQSKAREPAQTPGQPMGLPCQSPARAANRLIPLFLGAPAGC